MSSTSCLRRYSDAFQRKVVSEIESGKYTILQSRKLYDITGKGTVERWLRKHGKNELIR
jgi:transposase-like protein